MAERITWQSEPRADMPFAYVEKDVDPVDFMYDNIRQPFGPFSLQQAVELYWRVRTFEITGRVEHPYGDDWTMFMGMTRGKWEWRPTGEVGVPYQHEHEVMEHCLSGKQIIETNLNWVFVALDGTVYPQTTEWMETDFLIPKVLGKPNHRYIIRDTSGFFWFPDRISISSMENGVWAGVVLRSDWKNRSNPVQVTIPLQTGDAVVTLFGAETHVYHDIVLNPIEWWPYQTTGGLPAWDTTTGEPINGGPGA